MTAEVHFSGPQPGYYPPAPVMVSQPMMAQPMVSQPVMVVTVIIQIRIRYLDQCTFDVCRDEIKRRRSSEKRIRIDEERATCR